MKLWKDFEPLVALNVTGCPPLAIREALREAFDTFCEKTHFWQVDCPTLGVIANVADYDLPVDTDQRVVTVMQVKFKDQAIAPTTTEQMDRDNPTWSASAAAPVPVSFRVFLDDGAQFIRLWPTPSASESGTLKIRVALKLAATAENIPDFFYEDWRRVLASGAISRLCAIPGREYSNPELAVYHGRLFTSGMSRAMSRMFSGQTPRGLRIAPRRFC